MESNYGSMDRAHDVMIVICDAPVSWWTERGMHGMDLQRVYFRNDSQRYVHFGSHSLSETDQLCENTRCDLTGNVKTFKSKSYDTVATIWQYQWGRRGIIELPASHFLSISLNNDDIYTVMGHA